MLGWRKFFFPGKKNLLPKKTLKLHLLKKPSLEFFETQDLSSTHEKPKLLFHDYSCNFFFLQPIAEGNCEICISRIKHQNKIRELLLLTEQIWFGPFASQIVVPSTVGILADCLLTCIQWRSLMNSCPKWYLWGKLSYRPEETWNKKRKN